MTDLVPYERSEAFWDNWCFMDFFEVYEKGKGLVFCAGDMSGDIYDHFYWPMREKGVVDPYPYFVVGHAKRTDNMWAVSFREFVENHLSDPSNSEDARVTGDPWA